MPKYYDTEHKTEVIPIIDDINGPNVVELPEDHIFFQPLPTGKQFTYDADGIPNGYEDYIPAPLTPYQEAETELAVKGINTSQMLAALFLADTKTGKNTGDDRMKDYEKEIEDASKTYNLKFDDLVTYLFTGNEA